MQLYQEVLYLPSNHQNTLVVKGLKFDSLLGESSLCSLFKYLWKSLHILTVSRTHRNNVFVIPFLYLSYYGFQLMYR